MFRVQQPEQDWVVIIATDQANHAGAVGMDDGFSVSRNTVEVIPMANNGARIGSDNRAFCFEDERVGDPVGGPDIVDMFLLQVRNEKLKMSRRGSAIG